ncbi:helix-turn-helix domain-containing protein [Methylococcus mesophilus]|uniref:hypothetical protein n=1 Tax=Methylococcus mesophilus TaxID=2993564 RepID=UPI00224B03A2|nr:hypothetical protein [Methylococcus mesophilus]UZR27467.1 hypothetical protein OOT43_12055 [Methylococcus mesophilus]
MALYTPEQLRKELDSKGVTVESFAKAKSLDPRLVRDLLNGRIRGRRGKAHDHAVIMGLKDGEVSQHAA